MTLIDILRSSVKRYPHYPALTIKRGFRTLTLTYTQLYDLSLRIACLLERTGIQPGENVLLLAPNSPYWVAVYFGTLLRGCHIVPLTMQTQPEFIHKALAQTDAHVFFKHQLLSIEVPRTVTVFDIDFLDELVADCDLSSLKLPKLDENALAEILYTSGTTGDPKGVMLTHKNLCSNVQTIADLIHPVAGKDRILSILPLSHILEQTVGMLLPIYKGVQVIYAHSPALIAELMHKYRITKMVAVPEFLHIIRSRIEATIDKKNLTGVFNTLMGFTHWLSWRWFSRMIFKVVLNQFGGKLDTLASGGAPLAADLEQWWNNFGIVVLQGYGLTETSPTVTTNTYEIHKFGSVGKVIRDVQVRLAADGEILVKGPNVFSGYYKNEQKTVETFDVDGWFKTGDMGEFDSGGFLFLRGRKKYMILGPGGQNVFPEDIEEVLNKLAGVKDSAVLGIESAGGAIAIHAVLLLEKGIIDAQSVVERANQKLASYQHITDWTIWSEEDFPRSATRKVKKEMVRVALEERAKKPLQAVLASPLIRLLSQLSGVPLAHINQHSLLVRDLHVDSLKRVEIVARIEQDFRVLIDETTITPQLTVEQLQKLIDKKEQIKSPVKLHHWPRWFIVGVIRFMVQEVFFLISRIFMRIDVYGAEHIKKIKEITLFMPNHLSNLDGLVIARILPWRVRWRLSFAAAQDVVYGEFRYVSWLAELAFNCFPLPRQEDGRIKVGLENTGQMLDWGYHVVVFPEGKMSKDGMLLPLKQGAGLMATQMGVPVVPIRIRGIERIFPYDTFIPRSWGTVQVTIGAPLKFSRRTSYQEATQQLTDVFIKL